MSALHTLKIANPCSADWSRMRGSDTIRHCDMCSLNVYNISEMTQAEAETLINENEGRLCVRMYQRADGTVITRDCPIGTAYKKRRMAIFAAAFTGVMTVAAAFATFALRRDAAQCNSPNAPQQTLSSVQPFKTLSVWFPNMFPQPQPQYPVLMGDVAFIPSNNNTTPQTTTATTQANGSATP